MSSSASIESAQDAVVETVRYLYKAAYVRRVTRNEDSNESEVDVRRIEFERIHGTVHQSNGVIDQSLMNKTIFQDDELNEIMRVSRRIEFLYGHLFDEEIVNGDLAASLAAILKTAWKVQTEPLWVPATWVQ